MFDMADENQVRQAAKNQGLNSSEQEQAVAFSRSHTDLTAEQAVQEYKKTMK